MLIGSRAAFDNPPGQAAFNIAKAGVVALGKTIAQELEGTKATANVLLPSVIDTPAMRATAPYADYVNWPTPDEIASVAEFLISEESGVMTGAAVPFTPDALGTGPLPLVALLAILALVPFAVVMLTSFSKMLVVLSLARSALGTQQAPPTLVLTGLAAVLSAAVMSPVFERMYAACVSTR